MSSILDDSLKSSLPSEPPKRGTSTASLQCIPPTGRTSCQLQQLFARLNQEIEDQKPKNVIYFIVDFLCKHYPEHLQGFASIWNGDPELVKERLVVVEFFKAQKLTSEVAAHFTNAGFDTLETLCTLTSESLDDIERFNQTRWLPGHKVRLQQTFSDIAGRVRVFREEREAVMRAVRGSMFCHHPAVITKANLSPTESLKLPAGSHPAITYGQPQMYRTTVSPLALPSAPVQATYKSNQIPAHTLGGTMNSTHPSSSAVMSSTGPVICSYVVR